MEHLNNLVVSESELGNVVRVLGRIAQETGASQVSLRPLCFLRFIHHQYSLTLLGQEKTQAGSETAAT